MASLAVGFLAAFLLAALPGRFVIAWLRSLGAKQHISTDAPTAHAAKQGTPTMGGVLILFSLTLTVLAGYLLRRSSTEPDPYTLPLLIITLAHGAIGFADDYLSVKRGKNLGLRAREKFAAQVLLATGFSFWLAGIAQTGLTTHIELWPGKVLFLDWFYYVLVAFFMVGFSNATNITDGLDGLSGGLALILSLTVAALVAPLYPALVFFCCALAGALAGFLWWNAHPANVFMGDTGSLALGAALLGAGVLGKKEIGFLIAALVCWVELASVMIQVSVFKWRRRTRGLDYAKAHRVFRRSPLHHHFEESGCPETQVVLRFWIMGGLCAALALFWQRG
jgi:phospho-N-acetylmuramoyl-pentapeptide-transferase